MCARCSVVCKLCSLLWITENKFPYIVCTQLITKTALILMAIKFVFLNLVGRKRVLKRQREMCVASARLIPSIFCMRLKMFVQNCIKSNLLAPVLYYQSHNSRFHDLLLKFAAIIKRKH